MPDCRLHRERVDFHSRQSAVGRGERAALLHQSRENPFAKETKHHPTAKGIKYDPLSAIGIIINKTGYSYTIFWITGAPNFRCDYFAELDHYEFINLC